MGKYIFLALLFLTVTSQAQNISTRRDSLRTNVCWYLGISTSGTDLLTTAKINNAVNNAIHETCKDYPAYVKLDTVKIDSAAVGGSLNNDFRDLKTVFFILGDTVRMPVEIIEPDTLKRKQPTISDNLFVEGKNVIVRYCWSEDSLLRISAKWRNAVDTAKFEIEYFAYDSMLTSDSDKTLISADYLLNVIYRACSTLEEIRGNPAKADKWLLRYRGQ